MKPPQFNNSWPSQIRHLYEHDLREIWDPNIERHIWNQYHNQISLYQSIAKRLNPTTILDVGCAQATLALLLAESGYDVVANDIRPEYLEYAQSRYEFGKIEFLVGNIFDITLPHKFDLVFANQIIEHLVYPVDFLKQLAKLVKPGGHIVVTTPNHSYFMNKLPSYSELGDPSKYEDRQFTADADGHFFAYTATELTSFAKEAGFLDVKSFLFETPWVSGHMKVRYLHHAIPGFALKALDYCTRQIPSIASLSCHQLGILASCVE